MNSAKWKDLALRAIDCLRDVERETEWGQPTFGPTVWEGFRDEQNDLLHADRAGEVHDSDCAMHNEPASPNGPCDCSVAASETPSDHSNVIAASNSDHVEVIAKLGRALEIIEASARGSGDLARDRDADTLRAIEIFANVTRRTAPLSEEGVRP